MNSVIHFEIPMDDPDRAKAFYQKAFGWQLTDAPEFKYVMATTTELDEKTRMPKTPGAINGGMAERSDTLKAPSFAIAVDDIDKAIAAVKAAGGTMATDKMDVGTMGRMAYFKDTEGNVLSLWQTLRS